MRTLHRGIINKKKKNQRVNCLQSLPEEETRHILAKGNASREIPANPK